MSHFQIYKGKNKSQTIKKTIDIEKVDFYDRVNNKKPLINYKCPKMQEHTKNILSYKKGHKDGKI